MPKTTDIAIVSGARTPMGAIAANSEILPPWTGRRCRSEAMRRSGVDPKEFDHVIFGNAQQTSGDALYGARHVACEQGCRSRLQR